MAKSPGITITERDLTHRIPAVSTSIAAMIVCSQKGPVNDRQLITSVDDYINTFGEPNTEIGVYNSFYTADGFFDWGEHLWGTRCEGPSGRAATLTLGASGGDPIISYENEIEPDDYPLEYTDMDDTTVSEVLYVVAEGPGAYYNDISVAVITGEDYADLLDLATALAQANNHSHKEAIAEQYYLGSTAANGILVDGLYFRIDTIAGDPGGDPNNSWAGTISPTGDLSDSDLLDDVLSESGGEYSVDETRLGQYLGFENGPSTVDDASTSWDETREFALYVFNEDNELLESYLVSTEPDAVDYRNASMFAPDVVNITSKYIQVFVPGGESANVDPITMGEASLGAAKSSDRTSATVVASVLGFGIDDHTTEPLGAILTQLNTQYGNKEDIDIDIFLDPDLSDLAKREMDEVCRERMDCFAILSMPNGYVVAGVEAMKDYVDDTLNINSNYSGIYGQSFYIYDRYNDKYRWVPVSGHVGSVFCFNDKMADAWWAPAGLTRGLITGVIKVGINPSKAERDVLYESRINPIPDLPEEGIVVWGQKTLQAAASAFDRINVRRLFIVIESAIAEYARNFLFEQNDAFTRMRFVNTINPYLEQIRGRRGIYDYKTICDETNNTPAVIDRNEFIASIFVKPTRAVEFILLRFTAVATGISFSEIVG